MIKVVLNMILILILLLLLFIGYGLDDRSSGVRFPAGAGIFSPLHRVHTGSGSHPALYGMCTGGKAAGREADHSPPSSTDVKNAWRYTSTPKYVFMAWWLVKHRATLPLLYLNNNSKPIIHRCKVIVKLSLLLNQALCHEDVWESGGVAPHVLNFGSRWR
jgi:hypothetical protein